MKIPTSSLGRRVDMEGRDAMGGILIIEDESSIRENLCALLELSGYNDVHAASNGHEALELLATLAPPCLILLDLLMPVMTGEEFLEAKRRNQAIASIPVCVVAGVTKRPSLLKVQAFIPKPIRFDDLLKVIQKYCGPPAREHFRTSLKEK